MGKRLIHTNIWRKIHVGGFLFSLIGPKKEHFSGSFRKTFIISVFSVGKVVLLTVYLKKKKGLTQVNTS